MMRRGALAFVVAVLMSAAIPAHAQDNQRLVTFRGNGGQTAIWNAASASTIAFPVFDHPRLAGPDGTVGGVLFQQGPDVVGGAVLLNAPGFDYAVVLPLGGGPEGIRLPPGRYRVTLLGNTRQDLTAIARTGPARHVSFSGPARPITRAFSSTGAPLDTWSERLGALKPNDRLILGHGAGGVLEAHAAQTCLQRGDVAPSGPCLDATDETFNGPDSASWSASEQTVGADAGPFVYSGQIEAAGVGVTAGHVAVVVSPRP
jgi:hypothetical protein